MTREEQYLAKIAGEETDIPNKPILRSEQYLAKIAGEDVEIPEKPLLNEEIYLAILTGESYDIPAPYNRIEQYMAKACGEEIEVPTPVTRVEQYWAKIAEGESWTVTEITGTLPLTFLSKGDDLLDYRIHGTSAGEGVETENLFDKNAKDTNNGFISEHYLTDNGAEPPSSNYNISEYISVLPNTTYTVTGAVGDFPSLCEYDENKTFVTATRYYGNNTITFTTNNDTHFIRFSVRIANEETIMVISGSTAPTTYIPYGYKIPISLESGVTGNLLNPENVEKGRIDNGVMGYQSGTSALTWDNSTNRINYTTIDDYRGFVTGVFDVVPNSYYTLNYTPSDGTPIRIVFYNSSDEWLNEDIIAGQSRPYTITIPNDASKMRIAFVAANSGDHYIETPMLTEGSTAPDHYIPHRYTSNYDLFIGDSKLMADEFVDYGEQKVYKRTENLWNGEIEQGTIATANGQPEDDNTRVRSDFTKVLSGGTYTVNAVGADDAILLVYDSSNEYKKSEIITTQWTSLPVSITISNDRKLRMVFRKNNNTTIHPSDVSNIMLNIGSTAEPYVPYLQPTDPPVPLPPIPTYKGENTLSSTETVGEVTVKGRIKEVQNG